jgi:glycosyltransferase involved in cell wall biosynthesis
MEGGLPTRDCRVGVMANKYRIAIDVSSFDSLNLGVGQYRYAVNLISGLADISPDNLSYIVFGYRTAPVAEIEDIFVKKPQQWVYKQLSPWNFKGRDYVNHLRYSVLELIYRIDAWHMLHQFIPAFSGAKLIVTEYDLMYELFAEYQNAVASRPYKIHKWLVQNRVDQVVPISYSTAVDLKERWHLPESKISVAQLGSQFLGVAQQDLRPELQQLFQTGSPTLLSPFNLEPRKNLKGLLLAFQQVRERVPETTLILYGKAAWTPERDQQFQNLLQELELVDHVVLTGYVDDQDLRRLYQKATVFVFPSFYEGFGLPVLEAMSVGACVLACNSSSLIEVVGDGGILVDTHNIEELANKITMLLQDPSLRAGLAQKAIQTSTQFSVESMAAKTLGVYQKVLGIK